MSIMTDQEILDVVTAHTQGKSIEWNKPFSGNWQPVIGNPAWCFTQEVYRVKPEPKYRSYTEAELNSLIGKIIVHKLSSARYIVCSTYCGAVCLATINGYIGIPAQELVSFYTLNDFPCGVLV